MSTIISVASGKGGVGKSIFASNLSLILAQQGKNVILVDLDVGGADAHILFGHFHPTARLTDFLTREVAELSETLQTFDQFYGLKLIAGTGETIKTANMHFATKKRLIRHLRKLDADYIIVDVGSGTNFHALDFFLLADQPVCVATPEPTSVLDLYRFIKLAATRKVLLSFLASDAISLALAKRDFQRISDVLAYAGEFSSVAYDKASLALSYFKPSLVFNRVHGNYGAMVEQLQSLLKEYVGIAFPLIGEIPNDPAVDRSVRHCCPVTKDNPGTIASVALWDATNNLQAWIAQTADGVIMPPTPAGKEADKEASEKMLV